MELVRGAGAGGAGAGRLRTYLGTAPGVGKTFAMLAEGRRRAGNGERVMVGWAEWHGRPETRGQLGGLETIAPRTVGYRGAVFTDFDAAAAIVCGADVVLVDELARMTADRTRQRWEDVADVLHAGIDVVATMNVAHLRSVRDYAARITGVGTVAWVPDEFVRSGEVVLVDLPAEALRQRIASGAVYSPERVGGALADYFRASNPEYTADSLMCESLLRQAPDGSLEPGLATVSNPSPITMVFTLRRGVRFWDGHPVTSADVVYSLDRQMNPMLGGFNIADFSRVASITATSTSQVTIRLKQPDYWLEGELSSIPGIIIQKGFAQKEGTPRTTAHRPGRSCVPVRTCSNPGLRAWVWSRFATRTTGTHRSTP